MTMDPSRWVGKDEHLGLPSLGRPDAPKPVGWSFEAIAAVERPHDARVSPDGGRVAFILDRDTSDVWVVSAGGGQPLRVTTGRDPSAYWADSPATWSPDGRLLAYVAAGWAHVVAPTGGLPRKIAEGWSPVWVDDTTLALTVDRDDVSRLTLVDIDDPWPRAVTPQDHEVSGVGVRVDQRRLVYVVDPRDDRQRSDVWMLDLDSGGSTMIAGHAGAHAREPTLSPDGSTIAFISEAPGWYEVFLAGADGSGEHRLTEEECDFSGLDWHPDGARLVATRTRHESGDLVVIDTATGDVTVLAAGGTWASSQWMGDNVIAVHEDHKTPPRLVSVHPDGSVHDLLGPPPASVQTAPHADYQVVSYRSTDGLEIPGMLFKPLAADEGPVPAVVYPHGGPTSAYVDEWDGHAQYFISKGYAWFAVNFRGSTGYGRDFERANHGVWGMDDTEDCLAAADYLAGLDWVDDARIAIFGASYGAYLALAALVRDPAHRYACGVAKYGDSDITSSWATSDRYGREDLERMMATPKDHREAYREGSPLWRLEDIERPLLIAHGEQDERVHPQQSAQLVEELRRLGKQFEYVTYPTEGHGLLRSGPQVHFYRRLERFLDWHLM